MCVGRYSIFFIFFSTILLGVVFLFHLFFIYWPLFLCFQHLLGFLNFNWALFSPLLFWALWPLFTLDLLCTHITTELRLWSWWAPPQKALRFPSRFINNTLLFVPVVNLIRHSNFWRTLIVELPIMHIYNEYFTFQTNIGLINILSVPRRNQNIAYSFPWLSH